MGIQRRRNEQDREKKVPELNISGEHGAIKRGCSSEPPGRETEEKPGAGLDLLRRVFRTTLLCWEPFILLFHDRREGTKSRAANSTVTVGETAISTCLCSMPPTDRLIVAATDAREGCVGTLYMLVVEDRLLGEGAI